ncbi:hypothetical protein E2C01_010471 [Portunus trituberculatus]|uniref:Uncharacterized protein n=1 Tax=Portunus trituberculatus TaxID=210409 RepID=A0A5B7D8G3_PORTR|nr:hypothetical protein [Portunus trituberculatus]
MSNLFSDVQPYLVPMFSASDDNLDPANLSAMSLPPFRRPCKAFTYILDSEMEDITATTTLYKAEHTSQTISDHTSVMTQEYRIKNGFLGEITFNFCN